MRRYITRGRTRIFGFANTSNSSHDVSEGGDRPLDFSFFDTIATK